MSKIKLTNGKWIELNEQQEEALNYIRQWLRGEAEKSNPDAPTDLFFCLKGFAGTGKTTIVKDAILWYMNGPGRFKGDVTVTAPTHKAKKEISNATGLNGKTIQSLIGLAPNTDVLHFDINNPEFAIKNKPGIELCSIILIDEASMLNKDLFELLIQQAKMYHKKLLFMCDSAQLPPVNEEMSLVLTSKEIGYSFQLTKVERQAGDNPLMVVYDAIRNDINSDGDAFKHITALIDGPKPELQESKGNQHTNEIIEEWNNRPAPKIGIEFISELSKFGSRVVTAFASQRFIENPSHAKLLCWTNDRVKYWNNAIRKVLITARRKDVLAEDLGEMIHDSIVMPNEILMGYKNYTKGVTNAAEYKVTTIKHVDEVMDFGKLVDGGPEREFSIDISVYEVQLQDIDNPNIELSVKIVEPDTENYQSFLTAFNWYLGQGKFNKKWPMYFSWKEKYMLLTDIKDTRGNLIVGKDLDYAYALSVHKSQGSTFDQVFIDEADIDRNFNSIERNKLKYVALSRPRYKATVYSGKTD